MSLAIERYARVLVVEDDPSVRKLAEIVLTCAGYDVRTSSCPSDALSVIAAHPDIDVVLADVLLPEMSGFDLAEEAQRIAPSMRVVFMSGMSSDLFKRGISERFLPKPFTVAALKTVIDEAVS
jgi:two-component system, cell cycle sensor histidine kinase and response regulator CckA